MLATFANAVVTGHDATFEPDGNPWFGHVGRLLFCIGNDKGRVVANSPAEWLRTLGPGGFKKAYLWFDPPTGMSQRDINLLSFAGYVKWAPVTCMSGGDVIWHELPDNFRGGFRVMPGQTSLIASPAEAQEGLIRALDKMIGFQETHRPNEPFGDMFRAGMAVLQGHVHWKDRVDLLFPPNLYPENSYRLVGAVEEAWAIGGMGWWNDWSTVDSAVRHDFEAVTGEYYEAMGKALYAACNVELSPMP